jgi:hypothetical protein
VEAIMQRRAFVVMPFDQKMSARPGTVIDFNRVYNELLEPALTQAGYEVARADSERSAGDIRTDMFFELVTADLVVADVSIINANVFYELGIRHGVCPHGVFIIANNSMARAAFDIAPDRIFKYDATPFESPTSCKTTPEAEELAKLVTASSKILTRIFRDASAGDRQTTGSPVYSHLPGLKPVDWEGIGTSKANYFTALGTDWLERVRNAQARGLPGDIITLAMNAPTRMHESRILFEAAKALVDLSRFTAAARVLRNVIWLDPNHADGADSTGYGAHETGPDSNRGARAQETVTPVQGQATRRQYPRAGFSASLAPFVAEGRQLPRTVASPQEGQRRLVARCFGSAQLFESTPGGSQSVLCGFQRANADLSPQSDRGEHGRAFG